MRQSFHIVFMASVFCLSLAGAACLAAEMQTLTVRVTGLFSPARVDDLKAALPALANIELVSIDYKTSEGAFKFDPAKAFPGAKPEQVIEQFDNRLRGATRHTFGIRAACQIPRDKLTLIEIPVGGLDCKACCLGAYEAIYRLEGVEQATASFKEGQVTAWIDASQTDRAKLETALKQRGVEVLGK